MRNVYFSSSQAPNRVKKFYPQSIIRFHSPIKCSKKYPSSSTIFEQLNFQFVTSFSLSLPPLFRYRASNPFYATTLSAIFIHPFNERRSKLQASHPRISFDRGPTGIDWVAPPGAKPEAPSWNPTFSTSFDFSNRNRMSKPRKGSREERLKYSIYISVLRQHPANWMLKSRVSAKFFPRNERMEFERG